MTRCSARRSATAWTTTARRAHACATNGTMTMNTEDTDPVVGLDLPTGADADATRAAARQRAAALMAAVDDQAPTRRTDADRARRCARHPESIPPPGGTGWRNATARAMAARCCSSRQAAATFTRALRRQDTAHRRPIKLAARCRRPALAFAARFAATASRPTRGS